MMLDRNNLHAYQRTAVEHIKEHPESALFLDMGLGKTVSTLTAIVDLINFFEVSKVLIVAPKRVAEMTWGDEVENWRHLNGLRVSVAKNRRERKIIVLLSESFSNIRSQNQVHQNLRIQTMIRFRLIQFRLLQS